MLTDWERVCRRGKNIFVSWYSSQLIGVGTLTSDLQYWPFKCSVEIQLISMQAHFEQHQMNSQEWARGKYSPLLKVYVYDANCLFVPIQAEEVKESV